MSCGCTRKKYFLAEGDTKKCSICLQIKNIINFTKSNLHIDKYNPICRRCAKNKDLKTHYNISLDIYEDILMKQNYCCSICDFCKLEVRLVDAKTEITFVQDEPIPF